MRGSQVRFLPGSPSSSPSRSLRGYTTSFSPRKPQFHRPGLPLLLCDSGCVVAHSDHRIASQITGVLRRAVEGVLTRLLAEVAQQGNVSAYNGLQRGADCAGDRARAHDEAAHQSEITYDVLAVEGKYGGYHMVGDGGSVTGALGGEIAAPWGSPTWFCPHDSTCQGRVGNERTIRL